MSDDDLIRRGDALKIAREFCVEGYEGELEEALDALPALAPTDAAHVNETPKSEHDGDDVLTDMAAQAREAALSVLSGLSSYLGTGLGDDDTTAEQFDKRIRWAIDDLTARTRQAALRKAAAVAEAILKQDAKAAEPHDTAIASDRWEYAEQIPAAILRALEEEGR